MFIKKQPMKKHYYHLFIIPILVLGFILGTGKQLIAQGEYNNPNPGFTIDTPSRTYSEGNTIIIWKVNQTTSKTGLSHFNIQNNCLPTGSNIQVQNSSDNLNWTTISTTTSDGSTEYCQQGFGKFLKLSGSNNSKTNYYKMTIKGDYRLVPGSSILKFGNGSDKNLNESCTKVLTSVPELNSNGPIKSTKNVCEGGSLTLNVSNSGGSKYIWTLNDQNISLSSSLSLNNIIGSATYKVSYTVGECSTVTEEISINVSPKSVGGTAAPTLANVCSGSGTTINLSGYTGTIQWQKLNGSAWVNIDGQTSATLSTGDLTTTTSYRAVVTSGVCSSNNSSETTVNVDPTSVGGTAAPTLANICSGSGTTVKLSGNTGTIQWQSSTDNSNFSDIGGQTEASINTGNLTATTYYRAKLTSGVCSVAYSTTATVTVDPTSVGGTAAASSTTICYNSATTISVSGHTGNIKWQKKTTGDWLDISGTSNSFDTGNLTTTTSYQAVVTSGVCTSSNSTVATVSITPASVGGTASADASELCAGTGTTVKLSGNTGTIQWQSSTDGNNWTNVPGQTGASLNTGNLSTTTKYRAVVTSSICASATSTVVTITVKERPKVDLKSDNSIICSGNKVSLTAYSSEGSTYKWSSCSETKSSIEDNPTYTKTYEVKSYKEGCESENKASVTITVSDCKLNATYTQGFYGNAGGLTCDGMTTLNKLKSAMGGESKTFGGSNGRSFTLRYTDITSGNIFKLLPGGGTPAALNNGSWDYTKKGNIGSPVDSYGKITNNLLAQTITLWLNMQTSSNLGNFKMTSSFKTAKAVCGTNNINYGDTKTFNVGSKFVNKSVSELYNLAIKALTNSLDKTNDPILTDISSTIDVINNAFDQGRYLITALSTNATEIKTMSRFIAEPSESIQVIQAYPNPFKGALTFTITPRISGQANLDIYNLSGQKVATVFDGELQVGESKTIEYTVPAGQISQTLIFNFRQGGEVLQGKLVSL